MKIKFKIDQIKDIVKEHLLPKLDKYTIFTFQGPLGAGKTTLIKEFLRQAGISEIITSPTFNYVNVYKTLDDKTFNHFDLYRLNSLDEFFQSGFDEYFYSDITERNSYCLVEWPGVIESFLGQAGIKDNTCKIILSYDLDDLECRIIEIA